MVASGVRLYVADWGGRDSVLLFMPGLGNGAHIFDRIAPAFTDHFRVAALPPRGFPPTSAPDSGYTIALPHCKPAYAPSFRSREGVATATRCRHCSSFRPAPNLAIPGGSTPLPCVSIIGTIDPIMGTDVKPDRISRLLFGSTRRAVLALLLGRPDERFYLREIVRATGGAVGAVQRELKQLVDAGLVEREARGHQVYFSANRNAAIFSELQAIMEKTAGAVDVLRASLATLVSQGRVDLAFVYGSVATGKKTARSDIDLLIVGDTSLKETVPALRAAETRLGREINPIVYPVNEFRDKVDHGAPFLKRVLAGPKLFVAGDDRVLKRLAR
jgi:predicted nucleotidyltransferase